MPNLKHTQTGEVASQSEVDRRIRAVASCGPVIDYAEFGWSVIFPAPAPAFDPITHYARVSGEELTPLGTLQETWEVIALDAETVAANQARAKDQHNAALLAQIVPLQQKALRALIEDAPDTTFLDQRRDEIAALRAQWRK